jgi:hypothetical protein
MPDAKIDGQSIKPVPASVKAGMAKGLPKRVAMAKGPKPTSTVKI